MPADSAEPEAAAPVESLRPTWVPREMAQWCAPGGALHGVPTLAELCESGPHVCADHLAMDAAVSARAAQLAALGAGPGRVVAWQMPNTAEAVVLYRACFTIGAVAAPLHHMAGDTEVAALIERLQPVVFVTPAGKPTHAPADADGAETEGPAPGDVAVVLHTSGSSGAPKGVMHTHRGLAHKALTMVRVHGLGPTDAVLMPAPLAHVSGLLNGVLVPAAAGMRSVLMQRWDPEKALDLIESEHITFMVGPPTFFIGLEQAEGFDPSRVGSLRLLSVGGAGVTPEFVERTSDVFGAEVKRSYGSTEAPTITSSDRTDDAHSRSHSDGRVTGAARVRIVDPASGRRAPTSIAGEVQVSGPELFCGYTDPAQTSTATVSDREGDWFRTGDLGVLDADGRLTITGRIGNVIIRGGENIDTAEVEAHLAAHPSVTSAVVLGEPDRRLGERVVAVIEAATGSEPFDLGECRAWFMRRGVARFKTPERIVVVERIPVLPSGKADRRAVAATHTPS